MSADASFFGCSPCIIRILYFSPPLPEHDTKVERADGTHRCTETAAAIPSLWSQARTPQQTRVKLLPPGAVVTPAAGQQAVCQHGAEQVRALAARAAQTYPCRARQLPLHRYMFLLVLCLILRSCSCTETTFRISSCQKRSYLRAVRRAQQLGQTWYRGQGLTLQQLNGRGHTATPAPRPVRTARRPNSRSKGPRLRICSFNAGGLTTELFAEALLWATARNYQVLAIQESHWTENNEFISDNWIVVGSGAEERSAGCLLFLNKNTFTQASVRHTSVYQGRTLHARAELDKEIWEFINVYQKVLPHGATGPSMDIRSRVWESLDNTIHGIPRRHKLIVLGDFNSQLVYESPFVGRGLRPCPAHDRSDKAQFQQIVRRHQLTAVNTFGTKTNAATFLSGQSCSQLDFSLARQNTVDQTSKQACALPDAPLAAAADIARLKPVSLHLAFINPSLPSDSLNSTSTLRHKAR